MPEKLRQMQKLSITQLKPVMIFLNNIFLFSHELTIWISHPSGQGHPRWPAVKNLPSNAGGIAWIPRSGRFPGGRHGNPLQYSCLENPMDRGAWRATVHGSHRVGHDWSDFSGTHMHTSVFLPGKSCEQRSLVGYSPWGHKRVGHDLVTKQQT